jgi:hypothetical protein
MKRRSPRTAAEWEPIDISINYMVPMGFSSLECAQATGMPRAQLIHRANKLGIPFSGAFGPRSKCRSGHLLADHGFDLIPSARSAAGTRRCKTCHAKNKAEKVRLRRNRRGSAARKSNLVMSGDNATQRSYRAALSTNSILLLGQEIEREPRRWMRDELVAQMNELTESLRGKTA